MFKLLPTSEPAPSGPWHIAHFDRNSVALAALSCAPSARRSDPVNARAATASAPRIADVRTTEFRVLFNRMIMSSSAFPKYGCARPPTKTGQTSAQAVICDREIPYSLPRCCENSVAERGDKRRDSRLTNARRRSVAINDVYVCLGRSFVNSSYRIVLKIRLVDRSLGGRDLPASRYARAKNRGTLKLRSGRLRIYHQACIQSRVHTRDAHLALVIDLDLHDRGHVRQETFMRRDPDAEALAVFSLSPAIFFRDHLRDVAQTTVSHG